MALSSKGDGKSTPIQTTEPNAAAPSTTTTTTNDPTKLDTTVASPTAAQAAVDASPLVPDADRVAMVSRDKDGNPHQSANYQVLVPDDAPDHVRDAAHNKAGEALGAKHVTGTSEARVEGDNR